MGWLTDRSRHLQSGALNQEDVAFLYFFPGLEYWYNGTPFWSSIDCKWRTLWYTGPPMGSLVVLYLCFLRAGHGRVDQIIILENSPHCLGEDMDCPQIMAFLGQTGLVNEIYKILKEDGTDWL